MKNTVKKNPYDEGREYCKKVHGLNEYIDDNPYDHETAEYAQWREGFKDEQVSHLEGYEEYYS